jgi:predicted alpha/beta hydrolase family esterase
MPTSVLTLPGLYNSGAGHWQTIWEETLPGARRVMQRDWDAPKREEWVATLDSAIRAADGSVVLAAHSLGCATTAWWAVLHGSEPHARKVKGALLVAPPDVERNDFPVFAQGFAPMPQARLPFAAIVAASANDPWCALERARTWSNAWGAAFHDIGARGHINAESGLDNWPEGRAWLGQLDLVQSR